MIRMIVEKKVFFKVFFIVIPSLESLALSNFQLEYLAWFKIRVTNWEKIDFPNE